MPPPRFSGELYLIWDSNRQLLPPFAFMRMNLFEMLGAVLEALDSVVHLFTITTDFAHGAGVCE